MSWCPLNGNHPRGPRFIKLKVSKVEQPGPRFVKIKVSKVEQPGPRFVKIKETEPAPR